VDNKLTEWLSLVANVSHVELVDGSDYFRWSLTRSGLFSVGSLYLHLIDTKIPFRHRKIWKIKIPLKIKIFLWFLQRGVVLTKDNEKIGKGVRSVYAVMEMKLFNIYSWIVPLPSCFGGLSSMLLTWLNLDQSATCLEIGYLIKIKRLEI